MTSSECKVRILFEVGDETIVTLLGLDGKTMSRYNITDTDCESQFEEMLKNMEKHKESMQYEQGTKL